MTLLNRGVDGKCPGCIDRDQISFASEGGLI